MKVFWGSVRCPAGGKRKLRRRGKRGCPERGVAKAKGEDGKKAGEVKLIKGGEWGKRFFTDRSIVWRLGRSVKTESNLGVISGLGGGYVEERKIRRERTMGEP